MLFSGTRQPLVSTFPPPAATVEQTYKRPYQMHGTIGPSTAVATYDIEKMVKEMQSAVVTGVMGMDKFSEEVRRGVEEIRQVGAQLAQIIQQVQTLTPRFQTVNEGMHAQAAGAQQISETLSQLTEAAQQTADSLRQSNQAIERMDQ